MKNDVMPSIVQLDQATLNTFTTAVKETIATVAELNPPTTYRFSAASMWKIQQNARSASQMVRRY